MYDRIGWKIKSLAIVMLIVGAIADVITGIVLMASNEDLIVYGVLIMLAGPIVTWISSWILYGFGQLIENSDIIAKRCTGICAIPEKKKSTLKKEDQAEETQNDRKTDPPLSADDYIDITCPGCNEQLSFTKSDFASKKQFCPYCGVAVNWNMLK